MEVAGYSPNIMDISPRYAGIILGISNTVATIPGIGKEFYLHDDCSGCVCNWIHPTSHRFMVQRVFV